MSIDWADAPEFGRSATLMPAIDALDMIKSSDVVIVETGTTRGKLGGGVVGDGWATVAFGWYCRKYGGEVYTVDILEEAIEECKKITEEYEDVINYIVGDSVEFLQSFEGVIDFLYLDSSDNPQIILNELLVAYDKLSSAAIIVIDDTHDSMSVGKGVLACKHLLENGWRVLLDKEGQVVLSNVSTLSFTPHSFLPTGNILSMYEFIQDKAEDSIKLSIEDYDAKAKVWYDIFMSWLPTKDIIPDVDKGKRALDIGCNTGYNTKKLEEMYGHAVGIDINDYIIKYSVLNHDKCYTMKAENLEFDDESFSIVVAKDVLEHTLDPDTVLKEIYRVLANDGYIVCMIPLDGENSGIDDVATHPAFNYGNETHAWKATLYGVLFRLFDFGFSNVEYGTYAHSNLFGNVRPFGDSVLMVKAQKIEGIKKVPRQWLTNKSYWGAFLTMGCTGRCEYCIQNLSEDEFSQAKVEYARNSIQPKDWISFYNGLQKHRQHLLSIIGGEPTMYSGFFDVVNGIEGYYKTITTNLRSACFEDIPNMFEGRLLKDVKDSLRLNTSFHPKLISIDDFCSRVHQLRDAGFTVDQVAMVDHPTSNYKYFCDEFVKRGLALTPQTFLGKIDGALFPNPESNMSNDYREHGIDNYDIYREGFSYESKHEVLCNTDRFLVAPNGNINKCHYHLYSNKGVLGTVFDEELPQFRDYIDCQDYGYCNPCDYPHAQFRSLEINLPNTLLEITGDVNFVSFISNEMENVYTEDMRNFLIKIIAELYYSTHPYWDLYFNGSIRTLVNDFILEGGYKDNSNALVLASYDSNFFRMIPLGVNIYRLLDEEALNKYIDALGVVIVTHLTMAPELVKRFYSEELCKSLNTEIATIVVSLGLAGYSNDKVYFAKRGGD